MPPGPVFNWLAVAHSALVILDHALQYRAAQVTRVGASIRVSQSRQRAPRSGENGRQAKDVVEVEELVVTPPTTADAGEPPSGPTRVQPSSLGHANEAWLSQIGIAATPQTSLPEAIMEQQQLRGDTTGVSKLLEPSSTIPAPEARHPPAAEPSVPDADVDISRPDAPLSPPHLPIPESDASPDDVLLQSPSPIFYYKF
jgi:hypothetical protein